MTQKTTLPVIFTGPRAALLPRFVPAPPVPDGLVRRYTALSVDPSLIGAPVASVPDLTGKGAPLVAWAGPGPVLTRADGKTYLKFDSHSMRGDISAGKSYAVVARVRGVPASGFYPVAAFGPYGAGVLSVTPAGTLTSYGSAGITTKLNPGDGWHVFYASFAGPGSVVQMDDGYVAGDPGIPNSNGSLITTLGENTSAAKVVPIDIAELLIWDRALSATERAAVVARLRADYNL